MLNVTFYGVRGSTPSPCQANTRYGGNTSCVVLDVDGEAPIVLDLGTGLRTWGAKCPKDGTFKAHAFVTHFHWDHVQGLPFLAAADRIGAELDIYGPTPDDGRPLKDVFCDFMRKPFFPVTVDDLRGTYGFHALGPHDDVVVGGAKVRARQVPHTDDTLGYRIEWEGLSVAYISDHQAPLGLDTVAENVLELADGVDLLIHDAQYTSEEFAEKAHWGHCTVDYAVLVAKEAGAKRLALFHHDPEHSDDHLDRLLAGARAQAAGSGLDEVLLAAEGLRITLARP